jgi:hypothetical protein
MSSFNDELFMPAIRTVLTATKAPPHLFDLLVNQEGFKVLISMLLSVEVVHKLVSDKT